MSAIPEAAPPGSDLGPALAANAGLIVTVLVWGMQVPLVDFLLARWDPVALAALRYLCALPVLLALLWALEPELRRAPRLRPPGVGWGRLFLLGSLGMCGFAVPFFFGLALSDPVTVIVIVAASPVVAALVAWATNRTRPARGLGLAIVLAVIGGLLTRLDLGQLDPASGSLGLRFEGGEPLVLLAVVCWSWYSTTAQRWVPGCSQLQLTTATVLPAGLTMIVILLALAGLGVTIRAPAAPGAGDLALIVWLGISTVAIGIVTWNLGVKRLGVVIASMYLNLVPLVAVLTAALLGTAPRLEQILGGLIVIAGVLQAQLRGAAARRKAAPPPPGF